MPINFHEAQKIVASDTHRFRVCANGRRWGKTTLSVYEMVGKAVRKPDQRIAYIAPNYQQARDIAWAMLRKIVKPVTLNVNESRLEITVKTKGKGESLIVLRGWESIETLRGQRYDFIVIDEIAMMRNFDIGWQEVIRPTLTDTKGEVLFISTPKGYNHFFDLYNLEKEDPNFKSFHFTSYNNPFVPSEEIDEAKAQMTEDRFAQEYLAEFKKMEGLVYKEFHREQHLFDDKTPNVPSEWKETIVGVDWGYTNPAAVINIKVDKDDNYWIFDEWYKTKQTTEQIIEVVKNHKPNKVYPDPAEPDRLAELEKANLNVREVSKDIVAGIDRVRELFKQNRIKIHHSCKNLIWELETYRYPDKKPDRNEEEKPVKENDHLVDALRYALYTYEPIRINNNQEFNLYNQNYV